MSESQPIQQEIIIVRRGNNGDSGGHHGGAWKIAYADFVTAMMAFFLVMWLINSANEVTKSRVASYFNPIKMTDAAPSGRGLKNASEKKTPVDQQEPVENGGQKAENQDEGKPAAADTREEAVLQNPFSVIDEIVAKSANVQEADRSPVVDRGIGDPFDPQAWRKIQNGRPKGDITGVGGATTEHQTQTRPLDDANSKQTPVSKKQPGKEQSGNDEDAHEHEQSKVLEDAVKSIIEKHKAEVDMSVSARRTEEGLLIVLGDSSGRGMFGIGSAKPSPALIDVVSVIGKLLSQQSGEVVIRGHTDDRKFRSARFDNWQLSTARAHMASYMLIRGGLAEARIKRIEGHGAATPLLPSDPSADSNRRVEFLLVDHRKTP